MFVKNLDKCDEFTAGDNTILRELLHPAKENLDIRYSLAHAVVKPEKISYLSADEKYVDLFTLDGKKFTTNLSLKKLEERLPSNFKRIHRGIIVNSDHIKEFRKYFRGAYIIELLDEPKTKLETGRAYSDEIKTLISIK